MQLDGIGGDVEFGIWSDNDGPEIRAALKALRHDQRVRYLDEPGIPAEYATRCEDGEAAAVSVVAERKPDRTEPEGTQC